jgi:nucleotide-binding universal stress UspA family protein
MTDPERILIAIDGSEASARACHYVGQMVCRCRNYEIHLAHVLRAHPPELLEFPGAKDSKERERHDAEIAVAKARLIAEQQTSARPLLEAARRTVVESGAEAVYTHFQIPTAHEGLVTDILDAANEHGCRTIALGRRSFSWFKSLLQKHVDDELVHRADGFTVWVIE